MIKRIFKNFGKIIFPLIPDKIYLRMQYRYHFGKRLNIKNPKTYNEKLHWLKLYNRRPEYSIFVDKLAVRSYISDVLGAEYLIPIIGVYDNVDNINWESLPDKFVLKCTHGSSCNIICSDKSLLNIDEAKKKLRKWMKRNWYWYGREWPYKNVKPMIICEQFLETEDELLDYRVFCFNGKPKFIAVDFSITNKLQTRRNLYDLEWNLMRESISYPRELKKKVLKPEKFNEMIKLSETLSKDFPHVRIDFYYVNNKIYFGEMTFFHQSGLGKIHPEEFNLRMGNWIQIKEV